MATPAALTSCRLNLAMQLKLGKSTDSSAGSHVSDNNKKLLF